MNKDKNKNKKDNKQDNVIEFPQETKSQKKDKNAKQVVAGLVLVLTLFAVPMLNTINTTDSSIKRSISNVQNDNAKLKNLSRKSLKTLYSVGRKANKLEQFQFGELYGLYTIKRELNKISQVNLAKDASMVEVKDRKKFISKHKNIWYVNFDSIQKVSEKLEDNLFIEEFELSNDSKTVGSAIASSRQNGLVSISVVKN